MWLVGEVLREERDRRSDRSGMSTPLTRGMMTSVSTTHPGSVRPLHGACPARTGPWARPSRSVGSPLVLIEGHAEPAHSGEPLHLPDGTMTDRVSTLDIQEN